jgi:hypothetical protein
MRQGPVPEQAGHERHALPYILGNEHLVRMHQKQKAQANAHAGPFRCTCALPRSRHVQQEFQNSPERQGAQCEEHDVDQPKLRGIHTSHEVVQIKAEDRQWALREYADDAAQVMARKQRLLFQHEYRIVVCWRMEARMVQNERQGQKNRKQQER